MGRGRKVFFVFSLRPRPSPFDLPQLVRLLAVEYGELSVQTIEDVSINNEYEYENDFKPVLVLEVVFSAFYVSDDTEFEFIVYILSRVNANLLCVGIIAFGCFSSTSKAVFYIKPNIRNVQDDKERLETKRNCIKRSEFTFQTGSSQSFYPLRVFGENSS